MLRPGDLTITTTTTSGTDQSDWTEGLARAGLVARGIVYFLFGVIAVQLAVRGSTGGEKASTTGAFGELAEKPFGKVLVGVVAVGLVCWAAACAVAVVTGRNGAKPGPSDTTDRLKDAGRAAASLLLTIAAVGVVTQSGSGGGQDRERQQTARLMDAPFGRILVGLVGAGIVALGLYRLVKAAQQDHLDHVDLGKLPSWAPVGVAKALGVAGAVGRGLVFTLLGGFVVKAALEHQPDESRGIDGALRELSGGGPGRALLAVIAVGVVCYGLWTAVEARCRQTDT